jgi:hypothetical protein
MALSVQSLSIDSTDPAPLARFWAELLGWRITYEEGEEIVLEPPAGSAGEGAVPELLVVWVPEVKAVKNRLHLDLRPEDQDAEVARAEALGARRVDIGQGDDKTWIVMADPQGNEFCILRALRPDERE